MKCPQCKETMILTGVTRFTEQYHYCRTCKKELKELQATLNNYLIDVSNAIQKRDVTKFFGGGVNSHAIPFPTTKPMVTVVYVGAPCTSSEHFVTYVPSAIVSHCTCGQYDSWGNQVAVPPPPVTPAGVAGGLRAHKNYLRYGARPTGEIYAIVSDFPYCDLNTYGAMHEILDTEKTCNCGAITLP